MVAKKPLEQSMLDPNDCFILDTVDSNIYVWVGKKCTNKEKSESMNKAQHFLTTKNYPKWTHVQRVVEGGEPTSFTQYFKSWKGTSALHSRLVRAESQENQAFESRLFHAQIRPGSNQFTVEEVIDYDQEDLTEDDIMLLDIGKQVFVWVGKGASVKERTGAQTLAEVSMFINLDLGTLEAQMRHLKRATEFWNRITAFSFCNFGLAFFRKLLRQLTTLIRKQTLLILYGVL